ncbi:hypothetical protein M446_0206 [Methylobacterium sp. 4-46]|uniref:hypothetical protein n=1 Tax=Methylobacterium sp. CB376 TaxID=3138063 RepID=UPI000165C927|nr:hypothetical protein [Methylobacterium nodulans]ACA14780.1 hypothetical protein M446_0206 [Methylobacterium sp. 4-46]WFT80529.1 hypothetical protein QA634_01040 [Methylobacterium nodulans]
MFERNHKYHLPAGASAPPSTVSMATGSIRAPAADASTTSKVCARTACADPTFAEVGPSFGALAG